MNHLNGPTDVFLAAQLSLSGSAQLACLASGFHSRSTEHGGRSAALKICPLLCFSIPELDGGMSGCGFTCQRSDPEACVLWSSYHSCYEGGLGGVADRVAVTFRPGPHQTPDG